MAKNDNLTDYLTGLADKLRGLLGQTEKMNPQSFEEKIQEVYDRGFASGGPDAESITATAEQVVSGKTFGAGGQEVRTGTMPLRVTGQAANSCVLRDETLYYRLPHGCWPNTYSDTECEAGMGQAAVAEAIGLTAEKLVEGNTVLGVEGGAAQNPHIAVFNSGGYPVNAINNVAFTTFEKSSAGLIVPEDGDYYFVFKYVRDGSINSDGTCYFTKNGSNIGTSGTRTTSGDLGLGAIAPFTAHLSKGDVITISASDYYADYNWGYIVQQL